MPLHHRCPRAPSTGTAVPRGPTCPKVGGHRAPHPPDLTWQPPGVCRAREDEGGGGLQEESGRAGTEPLALGAAESRGERASDLSAIVRG